MKMLARAPVIYKDSDQVDTTKVRVRRLSFAKSKGLMRRLFCQKPSLPTRSTPTPQESKSVKHDNVIAPGMFRINPLKPSREEKYVPNKVRASVRTTPITVSQPHVVTKKDVNSDSNGLSSTGVDNTAKTRRPQPRSNTKNDRVPSASKSSCNKNKEVEVEEHHRMLLLVCAMCKQCLLTANHDVCMLNYVNDMNSRGKKQKANVSNTENQKKQKPKVKKPKKVGSNERLASPKPSKPRFCLRWSPTGRFFDITGKIIASSESESQSDCSNGYPNLFMFLGTVRFGNDHVAAILGFGDLQWGNILITRVYFVEGLGHNLFSVGQFCDSDLEVAFRRNSCFVRSLEGVDLLKGNRSTNLYTINLHEMASAIQPQFASWLSNLLPIMYWNQQRLSHLNGTPSMNLAKNDLVQPSPKFNITKNTLSLIEQGRKQKGNHITTQTQYPNSKAEDYSVTLGYNFSDQKKKHPEDVDSARTQQQGHITTPTTADKVPNALVRCENTLFIPLLPPSTSDAETFHPHNMWSPSTCIHSINPTLMNISGLRITL
ncbi:hypothetical protein Tco_0954669 [Tanacetum coccineum]|uniref:Integrase, catalytic region, zinc finger, CCHC-type, peptidase aspartic, catalytic n=1 Tax=Tanacetum coccineum TaxID=301880 RepID=A0ABQ5E532_9ASTR